MIVVGCGEPFIVDRVRHSSLLHFYSGNNLIYLRTLSESLIPSHVVTIFALDLCGLCWCFL